MLEVTKELVLSKFMVGSKMQTQLVPVTSPILSL